MCPNTLENVEQRLKSVAKEIIENWNKRQFKTTLQDNMVKAFGEIHRNSDQNKLNQDMLSLLKNVIDSLPEGQRDLFDADSCLEGFLNWNAYWEKYSSKRDHEEPIQNVHIAYENWAKESNEKVSNFRSLWENCMIRSTSEAECETIGSIMNIHSGRNRYLQPAYFSMELVLRNNLGPLHLLDSLVEEIFDRDPKSYVRSTEDPNKLSTKNIYKSPAMDSFQKRAEEKSHFPASFWTNLDKN